MVVVVVHSSYLRSSPLRIRSHLASDMSPIKRQPAKVKKNHGAARERADDTSAACGACSARLLTVDA